MENIKLAFLDIQRSFQSWRMWGLLGWFDIKLRYRRSTLGPLWITISLTIMVGVMAFLYSQIFKQDIKTYLPFIGTSMAIWFFISACITEGCQSFIESTDFIEQMGIDYTNYCMRVIWKNTIIFFHNAIVVVLLLIFFKKLSLYSLLFIPCLLLVLLLLLFYSLFISIICVRFRDVPQIIISLMQVMVFITPIYWQKSFLTQHKWVVDFNPIYHIIELLRSPLLGYDFPMVSFYAVLIETFCFFSLSIIFLTKYRKRISFWV